MGASTRGHSSRYSGVAIVLHWVMAALILFMVWLGHNMENHETRFQLHKSIGITLLVLTIARIVWRLYNKPSPLPADVKPLDAKLSKLVQFGFYALMLLIPLGGWIMVSISPFAVPTVLYETVSWPSLPLGRDEGTYKLLAFLHGKGATIGFLGLLLLHVAGAIKHEIGHESGVLKRILPGGQKPKATRGLIPMLIASLGFFGAVVLTPIMSGAKPLPITEKAPETTAEIPARPIITPNWIVAEDDRSITFAFTHDGGAYEGRFENWDATITFDPDDLPGSAVFVSVDLLSAQTGKKLYDDSLKAAEWFAVKSNPKAEVFLSNFQKTGDNTYTAEAALTLKGITVTTPFNFTLDIDGDQAVMSGTTKFTRKSLELGQDSDPDADWVSEEIIVDVNLQANKTNVFTPPLQAN